MSHTDPKSLANLYQPLDEVALGFARTVYEISTSKWFQIEDFRSHEILLSEAYLLLWQDSGTGNIDGRKVGLPLKVGAYAALFLDLIVAGKLEVFLSPEHREPLIRVVDEAPTGTYLDDGLFDHLRSRHHRTVNLQKWLEKAEESACVDIILDNLILRGILKKEKCGMLGLKLFRKFPTTNPQPEQDLVQHIRDVASCPDENPDSYILALLVLCREADNIFLISDPILKKYFDPEEYPEAKRRIDRVILGNLKKGRPRSWYRPRTRTLLGGSLYSQCNSPRASPRISARSSSVHERLDKTKSV